MVQSINLQSNIEEIYNNVIPKSPINILESQ